MVTHSESAVRMCPVTRAQSLVPNIWNKLVPPGRIHSDYFQFQAAHNFRSLSIYVLLQNIIFFRYSPFLCGNRKADMHHEALFEENHDEAICKSLRDRLIYAYIYVSSKKATVYTKSLRVTLTDHIANLGTFSLNCVIPNQKRPSFLGGLLGLFSGLSVLSLFEILHWACKGLLESTNSRGNKSNMLSGNEKDLESNEIRD